MAWFKKQKTTEPEPPKRSKISEGMWLKCNHCREIVYRKEVERNNKVCPKCDYHFPISVMERIALAGRSRDVQRVGCGAWSPRIR